MSMTLKVLLPHGIFATERGVTRVTLQTASGSFGLLPHRLDCTAALVPGILSFETLSQGEVFLAVDEGVLIKTGLVVLIAVRRALRGSDLSQLRVAVEQEYLQIDTQEAEMRAAMARLEVGFLRRFASLGEHPT